MYLSKGHICSFIWHFIQYASCILLLLLLRHHYHHQKCILSRIFMLNRITIIWNFSSHFACISVYNNHKIHLYNNDDEGVWFRKWGDQLFYIIVHQFYWKHRCKRNRDYQCKKKFNCITAIEGNYFIFLTMFNIIRILLFQ